MHQAAVMPNLTNRRRLVDGCAKNAKTLVIHLALGVAWHDLVGVITEIILLTKTFLGYVKSARRETPRIEAVELASDERANASYHIRAHKRYRKKLREHLYGRGSE